MLARAAILVVVIGAGGLFAQGAGTREVSVPRARLAAMPCAIETWRCTGDTPLDRESLDVLRTDDYLNRAFLDAAGRPAALFVAYYASQRQGDTIHSPLNCLPGSGWDPLDRRTVDLGYGRTHLPVTEVVVQRALDREVVVYWYQGRGRAVAGDYLNKFWLVVDAVRLRRSDGGLVRVVAPTTQSAEGFARAVAPHLSMFLP